MIKCSNCTMKTELLNKEETTNMIIEQYNDDTA